MLWIEAAFSACLAWHWTDHHWQCNWWVAWTSWRIMCAGKRPTLRATILTIFSHKDVSVFCQMWYYFQILFLNYHKFELIGLTFARLCGNILKVWWKVLYGFCWKFILIFPAVKAFWKSVKNWQSYRREFGVLLFGGPSVYSKLIKFVGIFYKIWNKLPPSVLKTMNLCFCPSS